MWEDSLKIFESDCIKLEKRYDINATPLYTQEDIEKAIEHLVELPFNENIVLFDDLTVCYYHASHIVNAAQVHMTFKLGETVKTLGFTGDIGSDVNKDYILSYESLPYSDIVLAECTYGGSHKTHKQKDRDKDIEKIKCVVDQCCQFDTQKVVFGTFSLNRLQDILTTLYKIYGDDETFATPVIIDAPLGTKISNIWDKLVEKDKELWKKVIAWKNIVWVGTYEESRQWQELHTSQIIISTSNFMKNGRIVSWLKSVLPNENARIMLCGYAGDKESVAYQIQHCKKWVMIDGERIRSRANVMQLTSFSSHACRSELLTRYTAMQYNKIYLVHSESDGKQEFAKLLRDSLSNAARSSKVHTPVTGDKISF
jgi:metallo-beta-lactamase family protein